MTENHLFLYKAFISHCDADTAFADWLAHALRNYRVGRSIVGKDTHAGRIFAGLGLIFSRRPHDDLRPLSSDIVNALFGSQYLIVITSEDCPKSEQVNKEIKLFKHYHGESRILYLPTQDAEGTSFPVAARFHVDADGALTDREAHPGQVIKGAPRSDALLHRIAAYLLGVSVDELATAREHDRWAKRIRWGLAGAAALILCLRFLGPIPQVSFLGSGEAPIDAASPHPAPEGEKQQAAAPIFASAAALSQRWPPIPTDFTQRVALFAQTADGVPSPATSKDAREARHRVKWPRRDRSRHGP